jgi:hypothetical protein
MEGDRRAIRHRRGGGLLALGLDVLFLPLFRSNSLREILAPLLAMGWMAIAAESRASGAAMA